MDCHFTEKISLLVDGELGEEEAKETTTHLSTCAVCQQAQHDFLRLRSQLVSYSAEPDMLAERRILQRILVSGRPAFWRRSIRLPVPAFALLLFAVIALGAGLLFLRQTSNVTREARAKTENVLRKPPPAQGTPATLDLARFDRGERAAIYKVRRTSRGDVEQ